MPINLPTLPACGHSNRDDKHTPVGGGPVCPSSEHIIHPRQPDAAASFPAAELTSYHDFILPPGST